MLQGTPVIAGPRHVEVTREEQDGGTLLRASHDGYADSFNVIHQRALMLADRRQPPRRRGAVHPRQRRRDLRQITTVLRCVSICIPPVKASRLQDLHGAMLMLPNKEVWTFSAYEDRIELEESVYLAGTDGPRRTTQLVIYGRARNVARVQWTLSLIAASPLSPARRARGEEPKLPL